MLTRRSISWSTFLVPLASGIFMLGICWILYQREAEQIQQSALSREAQRTGIFTRFFKEDIQGVVTDLRQLLDGDGLNEYLASGQPADLARAIHRARFFSQLNPDYDQVRYIDEKGQEIIRINWNGAVVPPDQMQNKADRVYFQKANALAAGQFYISKVDLNIEHGQIEQPIKPTIRVALPVFDATGRRRGIYVINYRAGNSIDRLVHFTPQYSSRVRILDNEGYWLKASKPGDEWGFMFPEKSGLTMAKTDPALWTLISTQHDGQVPHNGGMFTWHRVVPSEIVTDRSDTVTGNDYLVIASEITPQEWSDYVTNLRQTFIAVAVVVVILVIVAWFFFRARQRVQRERDRFFTLTRDMLCVAGFDGYFKRVNPAWEITLGYTSEEMCSRPFVEFIHPDDVKPTREVFERQLGGHEIINFENRYRCKDGSYRWLLWSSRPLLEEKLVFASARDMTERRRDEEKLLKLNDELKLHATQLQASNAELEAFSYSVSHDLRAPLRHIHGFVDLLQKSPIIEGDEASRRYLTVIAKAAGNMGALIDDLLAFSRTGRAEMHFRTFDMRMMVDDIVAEVQTNETSRKIVWEVKPLATVSGDASLLRQVWVNLISNAVKYTRPRAEAKIEIGQLAPDDPAVRPGEVVFYIRDNGVGFDMHYASKLFGVFQRLHRAEDFEGTGIGLANVQRIIHRHGGRVWAESQLDAGAVFNFSLPLTRND